MNTPLPPDVDAANKEKLEIISRLAGSIAHDYNNLLAVILLHSDMLAIHTDEAVQRHAREIKAATQRASYLTRQLMAFSGRQVMNLRSVDLNVELQRLEPVFSRILGPRITLLICYQHQSTLVESDPIYLEQVLTNIVHNAHDAMPNGGTLIISTSTMDREEGPRVLIKITDTGVGMDAQVLSRIFEPFFTTSRGRKTGLGLSTAFGLVKQMGGELIAASVVNNGASFTIHLRPSEVSAVAVGETQESSLCGNETILLVDDESMVRNATCEMLEIFGYQVMDAGDGFEALEICDETDEPIALALIDIEMDQMDGPTLAHKLRARWPHIPVLFMSGLTEDAIYNEKILPEDEHFISKPYFSEELAARIRAILDQPVE